MDAATMAEDITADQDITDTDTTDVATADARIMVVHTAGVIVAVFTAAVASTGAAGVVAGNLFFRGGSSGSAFLFLGCADLSHGPTAAMRFPHLQLITPC